MKVLSIRQPWASLIVWNFKDIENRNWKTNYRGPLLIHASSKFDERYDRLRNYEGNDCPSDMFSGSQWAFLNNEHVRKILEGDLPTSAIIGITELKDIGYYWPGQTSWAQRESKYHWHLTNSAEFKIPIPNIKGRLNLWDYDWDFHFQPFENSFIPIPYSNVKTGLR